MIHDMRQAAGCQRRSVFYAEWLRAPLAVGAIAPSGAPLADLMTRGVGPSHGPVVELGPGTGVFTRALLAKGLPESRIGIVERGDAFLRQLAARHPTIYTHHGDATDLMHVDLFGTRWAALAICGLPLLSMPRRKVYRIVRGTFRQLADDAPFRLFTYAPGCPVRPEIRDRLSLTAKKIGRAHLNLPPACVWELRRARPAASPLSRNEEI